jgi:transcriptional regulator with XRE-family HTH domain
MAQLQDLLAALLKNRNISARTFAERTGIAYPTLLGVLNKGTVPRKQEHRETLRAELGLDLDAWALVVAASQRDALDIPSEGPLTLQQLVTKALLSKGFTEQTFSKQEGIPYPTLMGITRKGSVPRAETLTRLAERLGIPLTELRAAAELSKAGRSDADEAEDGDGEPDEHAPTDIPVAPLAQLAAEAVALSGGSMASWARQHAIPYFDLVRLITTGLPTDDEDSLATLAAALALPADEFASACARSRSHPEPAHLARHNEQPVTALQAALQAAVQERGLTLKAFSELIELSPLTASKLLRNGELPGRTTTHDKLRAFLHLSAEDYQGMLNRSRPPNTGSFNVSGVRPATGTFAKPSTGSFAKPKTGSFTTRPVAPSPVEEPDEHEPTPITGIHDALSDEDLLRLIGQLSATQRTEVVKQVRSFTR